MPHWLDSVFRGMLRTTLRDLEERFRLIEQEYGRTLKENGSPRRGPGSAPEQTKWRQ